MAKVKVGIAGCLGRMGQELTKKILDDKNFIFVGGFEHKFHPKIGSKISDVTNVNSNTLVTKNADTIFKLADVVIDFTTPQSTLSNVKIASTISVPADATLSFLENPIYLDETDILAVTASANSDLTYFVSYEELDDA